MLLLSCLPVHSAWQLDRAAVLVLTPHSLAAATEPSLPQVLHHTPITGLTPNTSYYYVCGDPMLGLSNEYMFTTGPSSASPFPFRLGVVADVGQTINSTVTIQHLIDSKPQVFTLIGGGPHASSCSCSCAQLLCGG